MTTPNPLTNGSNTTQERHRKAIIGPPSNFWLHNTRTGFDLTHPSSPLSPSPGPRITIKTSTIPITVASSKSALVIIDMQNFFLSESLGRKRGAGHLACDQLIAHAIPAARKAGMQVIWLNWGLTEKDVTDMPPAMTRAFGFQAHYEEDEEGHEQWVTVDRFGDLLFQGGDRPLGNGKHGTMYRGLGSDCGEIALDDGSKVDAGRLLMRDSWNAALYPPFDKMYIEGTKLPHKPDVWLHKNRLSGMWGASTECEEFLKKEGIRTLFFAGVNTDQCVGGTLTDSFNKGYDCVLLSDGCGTTSPPCGQESYEYNCARTYGFLAKCEEFAEGVEGMGR